MESDDCEENETEKLNSILNNFFGESSDSDVDKKAQAEEMKNPSSGAVGVSAWEKIDQINGLWLCSDFLSPDEQYSLLSAIHQGDLYSCLDVCPHLTFIIHCILRFMIAIYEFQCCLFRV